ncbi:glycoside hydrolase family 76 protein [Aspergillus saccharolyticus JOP 1030-1]|uniref:Mannan endo-1,6-alpha-mannosidase n=1 Tax=Aspergillus saccharolyticus JOP 1030-1 TaxID=1450539 RepID=A0A318Z5C7_9EURO|nr:mannan endo-1,6-alpha-mannosidase [Aspergillus saccharolyticus JOP 1030-1]PYH42515.1 mannan endo-1,6-alpha-mannosidase [Aspergillus saccharolyticus JOP 1030-1]
MRGTNPLNFAWVVVLCVFVTRPCFQVKAIDLTIDDPDSIKHAARQLAWDLVSFYTGNNTGDVPGNLPNPYYWWEAGAFFGALVNYWAYTGDATYNEITTQAILHQAGEKHDFMPSNQTRTEGNDDQAFWAFTALQAAENNYPNPPSDHASWLALAQAVFNQQAARWDSAQCGGGLKWQIYPFNSGFTYRNAISNGCFFNMAARLARYTGNNTYAHWAYKTWDWAAAVRLIGPQFQVYDGTSEANNCSDLNHVEWTYNNGVFLLGAAHMWNYTNGDETWRRRIEGLLGAQSIFLSLNESSKNVFYESACETWDTCQTDQFSFKAYLFRWMADTVKLAPFTHDLIMARLRSTAQAAAAQCVGGTTKTYCGMQWTIGRYDGTKGVGQQMSALEAIQTLLVEGVTGPLTEQTGGSSKGDGAAGTWPSDSARDPTALRPITSGDQVGAAILTVGMIALMLGTGWYLCRESSDMSYVRMLI